MNRRARDWQPTIQPAPASRRVAHEQATVPFRRQEWEREATVPRAVAARRRRRAARQAQAPSSQTPRRDAIHVAAREESSVLFSLDNLQAMIVQRQRAAWPDPPPVDRSSGPKNGRATQQPALELEGLGSPLPPQALMLPTEREKRPSWFIPVMLCAGMALFWAIVTIAVVVNLRGGGTLIVRTGRSKAALATPTVVERVPRTPRTAALLDTSDRSSAPSTSSALPPASATRSPTVRERVIDTPSRRSKAHRPSRTGRRYRSSRRRRARRRAALRRRRARARRRARLRRARARRGAQRPAPPATISAPVPGPALPDSGPPPAAAPARRDKPLPARRDKPLPARRDKPLPSIDELIDGATTAE